MREKLKVANFCNGEVKDVQIHWLIGEQHVEDETTREVADDKSVDWQRCKDLLPWNRVLLFKQKEQITSTSIIYLFLFIYYSTLQ